MTDRCLNVADIPGAAPRKYLGRKGLALQKHLGPTYTLQYSVEPPLPERPRIQNRSHQQSNNPIDHTVHDPYQNSKEPSAKSPSIRGVPGDVDFGGFRMNTEPKGVEVPAAVYSEEPKLPTPKPELVHPHEIVKEPTPQNQRIELPSRQRNDPTRDSLDAFQEKYEKVAGNQPTYSVLPPYAQDLDLLKKNYAKFYGVETPVNTPHLFSHVTNNLSAQIGGDSLRKSYDPSLLNNANTDAGRSSRHQQHASYVLNAHTGNTPLLAPRTQEEIKNEMERLRTLTQEEQLKEKQRIIQQAQRKHSPTMNEIIRMKHNYGFNIINNSPNHYGLYPANYLTNQNNNTNINVEKKDEVRPPEVSQSQVVPKNTFDIRAVAGKANYYAEPGSHQPSEPQNHSQLYGPKALKNMSAYKIV